MKLKLHWQIVIALLAAVAVGGLISFLGTTSVFGNALMSGCSFIGTLFMNALKMLVVPLIIPSIICGMMGLGSQKNFGRLGAKTLGYYFSSGFLAILTGLFLVNLVKPGIVPEETAEKILAQSAAPDDFMNRVEGRDAGDFAEIFLRMIPPNVLDAATNNGQLLGVIFFSILFGFFISRLPETLQKTQARFWQGFLEVMTHVADLVIRFAPLGVFGLVAPVIAETGMDTLSPLILFFLTVVGSLAFHFLITLSLLLRLFKVNPFSHLKAVSPALLTAFSTASSASTLPVTLECVEEHAKVPRRVSSFTLPLGATVNMDGTALYECVVVIFIAQLYGIELTLVTQFSILLMALLTSVGVAGIPSASLVAIAVILGAVGLPIEAIGIVMVVDRMLDMMRTAVNVYSDTVCAAIVARSESAS